MNFIQIILNAAKSAKISGAILLAICTHESGLNNIATQDHGSYSYGICQVKYKTASMLGYEGDPEGLMIPETNAKYAALYLKFQYKRYDKDWHKTISAYNAGRYHESSVVPGCAKNRKYVNAVKKHLDEKWKKIVICKEAQNQKISLAKDLED